MAVRIPEAQYSAEQLIEVAKAIDILDRIFPYYNVRFEPIRDTQVSASPRDESAGATIRDKVLSVTTAVACSVPDIEVRTGLNKRQIRGVLSAPDMEFTKERVGGETRYQFAKMVPRERND